MRIQALSPQVANQIAAGEVIERPASVVKELLENALDAGADHITIDIGFGGLNLIRIADNGHGIEAEDLTLAIAAHATSKITQLEDLYAISSMGFRGEALASIAAVSRITICSKPAAQTHGMLLKANENGIQIHPYARTQGTTIEVCDLFYNTPVRKMFLKSERMEYQAIELMVKQFALSAPHITLTLHHNHKQTLHLPKATCEASRLRRIKKIFGQTFLQDALYIQEEYEHLSIQGWISQRQYQRSQRDRQWVYLNQRLIKDKLVLQAISQAYQAILHPGRYPSCVLYIHIAADQVDVNVHPTKHEVRFRQPRLVHAMLVSCLTKSLLTPLEPPSTLFPSPQSSQEEGSPESRAHPHPTPHDGRPWHTVQTPNQTFTWTILNPHFALLRGQDTSTYLIDVAALHRLHCTTLLQALPTPFPHRALLVPVRVDITVTGYARLEQLREPLLNVGLQFDFISTHQILIRTMPIHLPLLDLKRFFTTIQHPDLLSERIPQEIIACQTFDAYNMSPTERDTLSDYCLKNWDTMHTHQACLPLDIPTCQTLMRQIRSYPVSV